MESCSLFPVTATRPATMKVLFISPARFTSLSRPKQHLRSKVSHHRQGYNHSKKILNCSFWSGSAKPSTEDKASQCQHLRCKTKRPMCCPILVAKNLAGKVWNGWPIGLWCTLPKPFHKASSGSVNTSYSMRQKSTWAVATHQNENVYLLKLPTQVLLMHCQLRIL